jgi:hypothetical protein
MSPNYLNAVHKKNEIGRTAIQIILYSILSILRFVNILIRTLADMITNQFIEIITSSNR